ncbi:MAG: imidazole glycerol phosphate synthase subunit HisH [Proteobacteria bacterium]|nr:imidazole glycerol phosphate synthase subunit HisH [Pseudomonadota bacterium]MBU1583878.1 imidazole glycerol phosphate synthase subunit HisH [Pseudomonadota bacterium]MBU2632068.1 imidazole glycerol phosphate synthase subunit HisH [Pseudomonadota bacterium]
MSPFENTYIRVIPKLDIKGPNLVKGIHLEGLRVLGKPEDFARKYYEDGADELIYIDLVASLYGRSNLVEIVQRIANQIFIPLTVGGGVRSLADMHLLLRAGADKIAINTALFEDIDLLERGALTYGSQCMVVYIEAKKNASGSYECMHTNARENSGVTVLDWVKIIEKKGAGEIFLTFVDTEGTGKGVDCEFLKQLIPQTSIPVIVNGGYGNNTHILDAIKHGADAIGAASIFHYHELNKLNEISQRETEGNTAYIDLKRSGHTQFLQGKIEPVGIEKVKSDIFLAGKSCRMEYVDDTHLNQSPLKKDSHVVVVDYQMGNIFSLCRALEKVGAQVVVTSDPKIISRADYLVLPGVGAFPRAMKNLSEMGLVEPVLQHAKKGNPLLGICLGMQLLFSQSEEILLSKGLDIFQGNFALLFKGGLKSHPKLPHIGWNKLNVRETQGKNMAWDNTVFKTIEPGNFAYFVHSYAVKDMDDSNVLSMTDYGDERFCSAVQKQNVAGCQFHPELSGVTGLNILKQFLEIS